MSKIRIKQIDEVELSGYIQEIYSGDLSFIESNIVNLQSGQGQISGDVNDVIYSLSVVSGQNNSISSRLDTIESEFDLFNTDLSNISGDITELQVSTGILNNYIGDVETDLSGYKSDISNSLSGISGSLSGTNNSLSGISGSLSGISGSLSGTNNSLSGISGSLSGISGSLSGINNSLSGISGSLSGFNNTLLNYIHLQDTKGTGVNGGTFLSGAWRRRDLNTEVSDYGNFCSISSNQFTLSGGLYRCKASLPACFVNAHVGRLYNVSNSTTLLSGTVERSEAFYISTRSLINGQFRITGTTGQLLELQHYAEKDGSIAGFGVAMHTGANIGNIYSEIELWRISD